MDHSRRDGPFNPAIESTRRAWAWAGAGPFAPAALVATIALAACSQSGEERLTAAERYLKRGDVASATIELKNHLSKQPESGQARLLLGKALFLQAEPVGAEIELRRAMEAGVDENKVVPELATVLVALQRFEQTLSAFGSTQLKDPAAAAELHTQLAIARMGVGQLDEAQGELDKAFGLVPGHTGAEVVQVRLLAGRGKVDQALARVDGLLQKSADDANHWVLKGDVLQSGNEAQRASAVDSYRKALALKPKNVAAHAGLIATLLQLGQEAQARTQLQELKAVSANHPQTAYYEAVIALQRQDNAKAQELLQRLLKISPDNARLLALAGQAEMQAGAYVQAETHLAKARQLVPDADAPRLGLAVLYLRMSQPQRSLEALEAMLAQPNPSAQALTIAGNAQLMLGRHADAEKLFAKAKLRAPGEASIETGLALAQLGKDPGGASLRTLEAMSRSDTGTSADLPLINALIQRRDFSAALAAIDRLAAKQPGQAMHHLLRAQVALQRGDAPAARKAYEQLLASEPANALALRGLGELDVFEGQAARARDRVQAVAKRFPSKGELQLLLADYTAKAGGEKQEVVARLEEAIRLSATDPAPRLSLIEYALNLADNRLALTAAQAAAAAMPDNLQIQDRLGVALMANGNPQGALATFNRVLNQRPRAAEALLRVIEAEASLGKGEAAWERTKALLALAPDAPEAYQATALLATRLGRADDAIATARALQKRPGAAQRGLILEGEVLMALQRFPAATQAFRKAFGEGRSTEQVRLLHMALTGEGKAAEADRLTGSWLQRHPKDTGLMLHLALAASARNDIAGAEALYKRMLQVQPTNLEALNNLAQLYVDQKKPGAVELARSAAKLAPTRAPVLDTLAQALAAEGNWSNALKVQEWVVRNSPDQPAFRLTLAKVQIGAGKRDEARGNLDILSRLGPAFPGHREVETLAAKLRG